MLLHKPWPHSHTSPLDVVFLGYATFITPEMFFLTISNLL